MSDNNHSIDFPTRLIVQSRWLLWLRWFAVAGQLATVLVVGQWLGIALPMAPLIAVIAVTTATNVFLEVWLRWNADRALAPKIGSLLLTTVLALDLVSLTVLLYFTGGVANPFVVFYFVNVGLSAVILPTAWAWGMTTAAVLCAVGLHLWHVELAILVSSQPADVGLRMRGLIVALATCGGVICYFITRVTRELRERERQLRVAEQQRSRSERLEALATLAAGAGHELASPLSTIAVIAGDLARHLEGTDVPETVLEDVSLIRTELDYCRAILDRMSGQAGQAAGESVEEITVASLIDEMLDGMRHPERVETVLADVARVKMVVPLQALTQSLRGVVQNGLDASPDGQPVTVRVTQEDAAGAQAIVLRVVDRGNGMSPSVLRRVGEPFFTTKETGKGMGLGLFLTRSVLERLGGTLELESEEGRGTTATIRLPLG
ncbi:MAG: HAMP domain-containing histidine kinase [Planctomycetales bacterium]|nr:HAMP domain-containing histidine kinase [Planctomycetales bacterium]